MEIKHIVDSIYYVGVNDRVKTLFESLWPIPYGVSYNSYMVKGASASALIDTVEAGEGNELIDNIRRVLDGKAPDYLVINHMEPDHSGSIPSILRTFPDIKIVCNRQAASMIGGFYGITESGRFHIIKDGDVLDLGNEKLHFAMTPMVHWPETIMTYCENCKVIFSGDAFGCFGALNGAVLDSDTDISFFIPEMYRYYSAIVGKYGKFVQAALAKVCRFDIKYICPTHGPVWNKHKDLVTGIYDSLSAGRTEPGVVVAYGSMYGNTAEAADYLASRLADEGVDNIRVYNTANIDLSYILSDIFRYNGLIIASPTYSMNLFPSVERLLSALQTRDVRNKSIGIIGSYTWASAARNKALQYAEAMDLDIIGSVEMKQAMDEACREEIRKLAADMAKAIRK